MYCTHCSAWSVELWASAAAICCAPFAPMVFPSRLYAHVCVSTTIQHTCVAHDARSHTCNRVRGHIHPCIRVCRHTKYKYACMPCTYTYLHSSAQCKSIYHAHTRPTTTHSCEAGYVLHSLECLERRAVGKCCSNVLRSLRAYGVYLKAARTCVCEYNDTAHVRSSRCAIPYTQPSARSYTLMHMLHVDIPNTNTRACLTRILTFIPVHNTIPYTMHKRALLLRTHASRLCNALT
jgi:hypothetical protein